MKFQLLIFWGVVILFLILVYRIAKLAINKYFDSKKGRYDMDKNYISIVAIGALLSGFIIINPTFSQYLISLIVKLIEKIFIIDLPEFRIELSLGTILSYIVLASAISLIIYLSYRNREKNYLKLQEKFENRDIKKEISYPSDAFFESPHLHERIKELFELKYKKFDLILKEKIINDNNCKILYGSYEDEFEIVHKLIYCIDIKDVFINVEQQIKIVSLLETLFNQLSKNDYKSVAHFYLIINTGSFEKSNDEGNFELKKIKLYDENNFLNDLIDFKKYLSNTLIYNFKNDKIFSAIVKETDKKTLYETFIPPLALIADSEVPNDNIKQYIDFWLTDTSDSKHLVLLGDYGMGKTSFLKYYSATLAESIITENTIKRFPVFISLTNLTGLGIEKAIGSFVANELGVEYRLFQKLVYKGKILFILDAFDEMGFIGNSEQRFKNFNEIWQLAVKNNKILISGRPSYFPKDFELNESLNIPEKGFDIIQTKPYAEKIYLCELDDNRILKYIEKYYDLNSISYFNWIKSNNSLYDLCKRPVLTHIIREMLPELYNKHKDKKFTAVETMKYYIEFLINRQESKHIQSTFLGKNNEKIDFILNFFKKLTCKLYSENQYKISQNEISMLLKDFVIDSKLEKLIDQENIVDFEQELLSGYFIERENNDYRFRHKSFFEYFIAIEIIRLIQCGDFKNKIIIKDWSHEIIDYIYDYIPDSIKTNKSIPSLLLLTQKPFKCKLMLILFKHIYDYRKRTFTVLLISIILVFLWIVIISSSDFKNYKFNFEELRKHFNVILMLLASYLPMTLYTYLIVYFNRTHGRFISKSYKISFYKNQFDYKNNLNTLILIGRNLRSSIIEKISDVSFIKQQKINFYNTEFNNVIFNKCSFGEFGNVIFNNCKFIDCNLSNLSLFSCKLYNLKITNCFSYKPKNRFENLIRVRL